MRNLPLDAYHGAVLRHLKDRDLGVFDPAWWKELGELLDAWGKVSEDVARDLKAFEEDARGF